MSQNQSTLLISDFLINFSQILGQGTTSKVYQGINIRTSQPVAIKAIRMSFINNEVTQYLLSAQKKALKTIKNQNVLKCFDIIQTADFCYIVTQLCSNGNLKEYIKFKGKLGSEQAITLFKKILCGYISLIDGLFIHRDLKTANIMLRSNLDPVIIDFGYCETIMGKKPRILYNVGTISYMSPQAFYKHRYSQKSDIWSLGVILYEMLTGKTLDDGLNDKQFLQKISNQGRVNVNTTGFDQLSKQLLEMCFQINPQKRATAHRLKYTIDKYLIKTIKPQIIKPQIKTKPNQTFFSYDNPEKNRSQSETKKQIIKQTNESSFQIPNNNQEVSNPSINIKFSFNKAPITCNLTQQPINSSLFNSNFSTNSFNSNPEKPIFQYTSPKNSRIEQKVSFNYQDKAGNIPSPLSSGCMSLLQVTPSRKIPFNLNFNYRISAL